MTIDIVIPVADGRNPERTLRSLARQTWKLQNLIVVWDHDGNAAKARNGGARLAHGNLVLFSDDDIEWRPDALEALMCALLEAPRAAYAYGRFLRGHERIGRPFDAEELRRRPYISTMSLIRRAKFPGFDERLKRLQDWDLYLTMLERGHEGTFVDQVLFETEPGSGISFGDRATRWEEAAEKIRRKHFDDTGE